MSRPLLRMEPPSVYTIQPLRGAPVRASLPVTPATVTAALADGLDQLLTMWQQALADRDDVMLDWLAPRIVARATHTISYVRRHELLLTRAATAAYTIRKDRP